MNCSVISVYESAMNLTNARVVSTCTVRNALMDGCKPNTNVLTNVKVKISIIIDYMIKKAH